MKLTPCIELMVDLFNVGLGQLHDVGLSLFIYRCKECILVRNTYVIISCIFQLLGCAILGIGIWLHISKGNYASIAPSFNFLSATALCIAAGAIVLVVGFFGCCGAIMENPCMLLTVS